jgi:preprotein translocase subunit SecG
VIYLLYVLHVLICLFLILVVLLQQGKGADLSVFGGGSTLAAFGARSATNLLHRLTVGAFVGFVLTTLAIAFLKGSEARSIIKDVPAASQPAPASPAPAAAPASTDAPEGRAPASQDSTQP